MNMNEKKKITEKEIDAKMYQFTKAYAIEKLSNKSLITPEIRALLDKLANDELTSNEIIDLILKN